jgi:hypothetical protein
MKTAYIHRGVSTDQGTFSAFSCPDADFSCMVAELPWKDNQSCMSCIPKGEYEVKPVQSPKYGMVFMVFNVTNRRGILWHSGNYAGDTEKGWKTHSLGCILPGQKVASINGQKGVTLSRYTVSKFHLAMGTEPFKLIIL